MPTSKKIFPFLLLIVITTVFFRSYFLNGFIPFPGDLLLSEYQPFRSYSYNGYVAGALPNKAQYFDVLQEFFPWRTEVNKQLQQGSLPLWNPYVSSGAPLLANFQTAVFYPLNLLYRLVDAPSAWALLVLLQPLLTSIFTYVYSRKIGVSQLGSLLTSIAFAYSSYCTVWLEFNTIGHTILWLPLTLLAIEYMAGGDKRWRFRLLFVGAATSSLFAGHPIDFGVTYVFAFVYFLLRLQQADSSLTLFSRVKRMSIFALPLLIGIPQLAPTIAFTQSSTRSFFQYDFFINHLLIQPYQLIMLLIPDFFGNPATRNYSQTTSYVAIALSIGIAPIVMALFAFKRKLEANKQWYIRVFLYTSGVILILTTNQPISQLLYRLQLPVISTNSPTKLLSLFAFSLSVLAGFGLDQWMKEKRLREVLKRCIPLLIIFITAATTSRILLNNGTSSLRSVMFSTSIFILTSAIVVIPLLLRRHTKIMVKIGATLIIAITVGELQYSFTKFNPFIPRSYIFPETNVITYLQKEAGINRIWGYGTAKIAPNILSYYRLFSTDGFDALNLRWYSELIYASKDGHIKTTFTHENRSIAEMAPGYGKTDLPNNIYRLRMLDILGVKYILDRVENPQDNNTFPDNRFKLVWSDDAGWRVFENLKAAPRFFLTRNIQTYNSTEQFETLFFADGFNPYSTILLSSQDTSNVSPQIESTNITNAEKVELISYLPNKVQFKTVTESPTLLYLSDTFDNGWKAYVDHQEITLYQANYAFRAVVVPAGTHEVIFIYKPSIYQFIL